MSANCRSRKTHREVLLRQVTHIAIEGVIGVGKTTLAHLLAGRLSARLVLEEVEENPFLPFFYEEPERYAFQTQVFFLLSRYRQQETLLQQDLFQTITISDYFFAKDAIFAHLTLSDHELKLYGKLASLLNVDVPVPDLVIYLQDSSEHLMENIRSRGREYERNTHFEYIQRLNEAYNHFFFHYSDTPLLVVNITQTDFENNPGEVDDLLHQIENPPAGTKYYIPAGADRTLEGL